MTNQKENIMSEEKQKPNKAQLSKEQVAELEAAQQNLIEMLSFLDKVLVLKQIEEVQPEREIISRCRQFLMNIGVSSGLSVQNEAEFEEADEVEQKES